MKTQKKPAAKVQKGGCKSKKDVISIRKTCDAKGTGLSHYILMDRKAK